MRDEARGETHTHTERETSSPFSTCSDDLMTKASFTSRATWRNFSLPGLRVSRDRDESLVYMIIRLEIYYHRYISRIIYR